jgi:hypothetical protein
MSSDELELPPRGLITLFRRPLVLDERGLRIGKKQIAWDDVEFYTYTWEDGFIAGDIYVVARDDRWMRIDNRFYCWRQAADRILAELHPRLRAAPDYHPFRLSATEVRHARSGALPLADIDRVEIAPGSDGPTFEVFTRSSREWSIDGLETIHNVVLLLEDFVARGIAVRAEVPLWLPPSVGRIADEVARPVTLPQAEIVRR